MSPGFSLSLLSVHQQPKPPQNKLKLAVRCPSSTQFAVFQEEKSAEK